mmetsp:Transcript_3463/g.7014  ORF Transcript_3463/g.7014 Transcript_3463/m.7014 type:complete len:164 (-) Transcript_3463:78-569(-)
MASLQDAMASASSSDVISFNHQNTAFTLIASLDANNGGLKFENDSSEDAEIHRHLQTKKWISPMLNDRSRNEFYKLGIRRAVESLTQRSGSDAAINVLDIGTGTGLLAMLSAQASTKVKVESVEMSSPMAKLAERIVEGCGLSERISIRNIHSNEVEVSARNE